MKHFLSCLFILLQAIPSFAGDVPAKKMWADSFLGKPGPELIVAEWITPKPDVEGKFILVDFWATWCGPCRRAIPELNEIHKRFGDRLVVIGLSDETSEKVKAMKEPQIAYAQGVDPEGTTKQAYGVRGIPHVVLLDPQGIVRWEGFPLLSGHELTPEVVEEILNREDVDKPAAPPGDHKDLSLSPSN